MLMRAVYPLVSCEFELFQLRFIGLLFPGKEGPYVHISAMVAYQLAKLPIFTTIKKVPFFQVKTFLYRLAPGPQDSNVSCRLRSRGSCHVRCSCRWSYFFSGNNFDLLSHRKFMESLFLCNKCSSFCKNYRKSGVYGFVLYKIRRCSLF